MVRDTLGENADILMGQSPPGETCNTSGVGIPLLNGPTEYGPHHPTPVQFSTDARKIARQGDLLFCVRGATTGRMNWADREYAIGRGVAAIRHKRKPELQPFVRAVIEYGLSSLLAQATGSTFANVSAGQLAGIWWPPLRELDQLSVARILGLLDERVELNRRMNETLEAMARALFKSWFVEFDPVRAKAEGRDPGLPKSLADLFPDSFEDSELGKIPKGWRVGHVGDYMVNFDSKRVPVSGAERAKRQGQYPYHGAAGVLDHVDDYLFDGIYLLVGEDGSVVDGNGMAVTQYVWGQLWVNNHAHVLQGNGEVSTEQLYLYFHFEPVAPYVTGAVQPKLSQGRMNTMPFVFAGEVACRAFGQIVQPWFAKLRANVDMTRTISALRDTLPPKLISGEVSVSKAHRFAAPATR
jgi:type I restriction enzyme, S subunit